MIPVEAIIMMWVLMLSIGLAVFAAVFGFVFVCDRLWGEKHGILCKCVCDFHNDFRIWLFVLCNTQTWAFL